MAVATRPRIAPPQPRVLRPRQPNSSPCWYGRNVRRRISSASARLAAYRRSCADLLLPLAAADGEGFLILGASGGGGGVG
ncbi:hypothetical protein E2562_003996 [Oryza meyeriana var. granulata]|uniref:Uncharacterized protein n=1 Tax=Oryza meyeriana var. granulata TaxID=110450 RepID=A0A6G1BK16_9ORYZ|nr:hypothetical protein E2562_003996 [Oryza meyeriana var. granulata]